MRAQPSEHDSHDVIRLSGETAVVVPVHEYRTLKALRDCASAEQVEEAEIDAAITEHEAWKAAGRPGLKPREEFMAEVFGGSVRASVNASVARPAIPGWHRQQAGEHFVAVLPQHRHDLVGQRCPVGGCQQPGERLAQLCELLAPCDR
jgi:hypothetical protein